jgi:hypothetical protein
VQDNADVPTVEDVHAEDATHGDGVADEDNHVWMLAVVMALVWVGNCVAYSLPLCVNVSDLQAFAPGDGPQNGAKSDFVSAQPWLFFWGTNTP